MWAVDGSMQRARSTKVRGLATVLVAVGMAVPLSAVALASSPAPEATSQFAPDQLMVRFRDAPSETDLEIFTGRQFLTFLDYVGLSYPPGLGWYLFRIDDGMDAAIVRDLLWKDPMVCNAELVAIGEWFAVGLPDADDALPCVDLPSSALPEATETQQSAAQGGSAEGLAPSGQPLRETTPTSAVFVLLLGSVLFFAIASCLRLRSMTKAQ